MHDVILFVDGRRLESVIDALVSIGHSHFFISHAITPTGNHQVFTVRVPKDEETDQFVKIVERMDNSGLLVNKLWGLGV